MAKAMFDAASVQRSNLLTAVPIVPGVIVSKSLVNTAGCKVIVFAMDAGQSISEHHAPFVATVQVLDAGSTSASLARSTRWPPTIGW